ncbi:MAG: undecaprenyldiphospho-muramoylpentapeptide beta-N-acetylglucosaminyltransferase [Patescibacteria group bacterium]|nr:undecaprenyldiphospho-muramoylpentapeptide beta-N-acetylglucosaminyltransferase [Patescibacteria group bacterium]
MKILLTGGGTGGHLYPLLAIAEKIKQLKGVETEILFIGPVNDFSRKILKDNGIKTQGILTAKWRRYWSFENILDIFKFPIGLIQSLVYVLFFMPDVVFSKGGYGSVAPTLAARVYWIPVLIHESDVFPGRANILMGKLADRIAISFTSSKKYFNARKVLVTGNPIRANIREGNIEKAREFFNLRPQKPVLLIIGGSQGSEIINERILGILPSLLESYQIIHQVGKGNLSKVKEIAGRRGIKIGRSDYHPYEFLGNEIIHAYKICDLVISRAGAGSIVEIAAVRKPSILIPLRKSANGHQLYNAYAIAKKGGTVIVEEANLRDRLLLTKIDRIMEDVGLREKMSQAIAQFYHPDAAEKITESLVYLAKIGAIKGKGFFEKE